MPEFCPAARRCYVLRCAVQRAKVHDYVQATFARSLETISRGFDDSRFISVVRKGAARTKLELSPEQVR